MRNKRLLILIIAALSATVVLQNTGSVILSFLWTSISVAKSTIILGALAIGFILGMLFIRSNTPNSEDTGKNKEDEDYLN